MTTNEETKTLEAMRDHLEWNKGDVATISAMADLCEDLGDTTRSPEHLRQGAKAAAIVNSVNRDIAELTKKFEQQIALLNLKKNAAQKSCPHSVREYYPDASGNNDSTTTCLCCGADI